MLNDNPNEAADTTTPTNTANIAVEALGLGGDSGATPAMPGVGDEIDAEVTGKILSITGGIARVSILTINGKPVGPAPAEPSEEDALKTAAKQADADAGELY